MNLSSLSDVVLDNLKSLWIVSGGKLEITLGISPKKLETGPHT